MRVKLSEITSCRTEDEVDAKIAEILKECKPDDPPMLSDLIVNISAGGQPLMIALGDLYAGQRNVPIENQFNWTIQVLRDTWGNKPQPGDKVARQIQKSLYKKEGKPIPSTELSRAKRDGSYNDRFIDIIEYPVDEKGCIVCTFESAVHFINLWGVHPITGYSISTKPEHMDSLSMAPDGQMRHVWYWRYKEMDKEMYAKLPKLELRTDPIRGSMPKA